MVKPLDLADRMIWVSLPRATFGIIVRNGCVVDGAPYARGRGLQLVGMDERAAAEKLRRLGARFEPLPRAIDTAVSQTVIAHARNRHTGQVDNSGIV